MLDEGDRRPDLHDPHATLDEQIAALQLAIWRGDERLGLCMGRLREGWNAKKKYIALGGVATLAAAWLFLPRRVLKRKVAAVGQRLRDRSPQLLARWGLSLLMPIVLGALSKGGGESPSESSPKGGGAFRHVSKQVLGMLLPLLLKPRVRSDR